MQSLNTMDGVVEWQLRQQQTITDYTHQINACIINDRWEDLPAVLNARLSYLQELFSSSLPSELRGPARELIQSILAQDAAFQNQIQQNKKVVAQQCLVFERSRRAIQNYGAQIL